MVPADYSSREKSKDHQVPPSKHLKTVGQMPFERYVTTYSRDYKAFSERRPQVNQLKPRTEAQAAPAFISPPQAGQRDSLKDRFPQTLRETLRETWYILHQYFYKTTNSIYGSGSQPASCSLFPASLGPFGVPAAAMSEVSGGVGVERETWPLPGEEERGQLHDVFSGKANVLEQREANEEPQQKIDVVYVEGVIGFSSHVNCWEDFVRSVCREARLQQLLLHLPVADWSIITIKDAENWDNGTYMRGLGPATGLKNSTFLQLTSRQCSCCAWETEFPNSFCLTMKTCIPRSGTLPPAHVLPTVYGTEPSRKLPLTEYQARYTAEWAQPKMQQSDLHHRD